MSRRKKVSFILILFSIVLLSFLLYNFINNQPSENDKTQHDTSFYDNESIVYLGEESLDNEILFVFDYSCIWCSRWMDEMFPEINQLVNEKKVKFRTQSMVFLNNASLELSKLDQNIKMHYPENYYEIFSQIIADGLEGDHEQLLADHYIESLIAHHQLDNDKLVTEPILDVINLTRKYTNALEIESVPTIIVNGIKIDDPFDLKEIQKRLN